MGVENITDRLSANRFSEQVARYLQTNGVALMRFRASPGESAMGIVPESSLPDEDGLWTSRSNYPVSFYVRREDRTIYWQVNPSTAGAMSAEQIAAGLRMLVYRARQIAPTKQHSFEGNEDGEHFRFIKETIDGFLVLPSDQLLSPVTDIS